MQVAVVTLGAQWWIITQLPHWGSVVEQASKQQQHESKAPLVLSLV